MTFEGYKKEGLLQQGQIEESLRHLHPADSAECQKVVQDAVRVAHELFFSNRFGYFTDGEVCVLYSNMGPNNLHLRHAFADRLAEWSIDQLAGAVWPEEPDDAYSWAVLFVDDCADTWFDEIWRLWARQTQV